MYTANRLKSLWQLRSLPSSSGSYIPLLGDIPAVAAKDLTIFLDDLYKKMNGKHKACKVCGMKYDFESTRNKLHSTRLASSLLETQCFELAVKRAQATCTRYFATQTTDLSCHNFDLYTKIDEVYIFVSMVGGLVTNWKQELQRVADSFEWQLFCSVLRASLCLTCSLYQNHMED